jgi:hypothetical protein
MSKPADANAHGPAVNAPTAAGSAVGGLIELPAKPAVVSPKLAAALIEASSASPARTHVGAEASEEDAPKHPPTWGPVDDDPTEQDPSIVPSEATVVDDADTQVGDTAKTSPPPTIVGTEPFCVPTAGGTVVTLLGGDFAEACRVEVDGVPVPCARVHESRIDVVVKPHAVGNVSLVVINSDGQRASRQSALRFAEPPVVIEVLPPRASPQGGEELRVLGHGFEPGAVVLIADAAAEGVRFVSAAELCLAAPPSARTGTSSVDVTVVNPCGLAHCVPNAFAYKKPPPRILEVSPACGPSTGETRVVVTGQSFDTRSTVYVCGIPATVIRASETEIVIVTPSVPGDGPVDIRVVDGEDQTHVIQGAFCYQAALAPPILTAVSPNRGSELGGQRVAILGDGFTGGVTVRFEGAEAAAKLLSRTELQVTTPAHPRAGPVTVTVTSADGTTVALENGFVYEARATPALSGIHPKRGPTTGGTRVVLEGQHFTRECRVYVGRELPKEIAWKSATEIEILTAPRRSAGVVDVELTLAGVPSAILKNGYSYDAVAAPTISSVTPSAGCVAGGTEMTITGRSFLRDTVVLVGGKTPKYVKWVDSTTLELKTPPGTPNAMVDVVLRNPDGKEAVQKRAFLYDPRFR